MLEIFPGKDLAIVVLINQGVVEDVSVEDVSIDIVQQIAAVALLRHAVALRAAVPGAATVGLAQFQSTIPAR